MPRPAVTPEQRRKTRQRIRSAASRLVDKRRMEDITVRAVAAEAGVSVGTIYSYFENLSELAMSLWQEPVNELRKQVNATAEKIQDPLQRIRTLLDHYARFAEQENKVFRRVLLYVRPDYMKKPDKYPLEDEQFFSYLCESIEQGQRDGTIVAGEPRVMAQTLWAGVHGALALPITLDRLAFDGSVKMAQHMIDSLIVMITAKA